MNVMTNCSNFGHLCLPSFVGAGLHRHLQRHPRHVAALLPLVREPLAGGEPLEARVVDGGREVEQRDITVVLLGPRLLAAANISISSVDLPLSDSASHMMAAMQKSLSGQDYLGRDK